MPSLARPLAGTPRSRPEAVKARPPPARSYLDHDVLALDGDRDDLRSERARDVRGRKLFADHLAGRLDRDGIRAHGAPRLQVPRLSGREIVFSAVARALDHLPLGIVVVLPGAARAEM